MAVHPPMVPSENTEQHTEQMQPTASAGIVFTIFIVYAIVPGGSWKSYPSSSYVVGIIFNVDGIIWSWMAARQRLTKAPPQQVIEHESVSCWSNKFLASSDTYLGQVTDVVRVQQQLLEAVGVAEDLLRHVRQRRVPVVDVLDLPVASLEDGHFLTGGN
uniref:Uncharacterized protein n=1 Tax=Anopheles atroparvus TaxID=41427 RepID=A0A182JM13_ANOAO